MLKNDSLTPYLLKEEMDCYETAEIKHLKIIGRGCITNLVLLTLTLFSRSYADSFFKNDIAWTSGWNCFPNLQLRCIY